MLVEVTVAAESGTWSGEELIVAGSVTDAVSEAWALTDGAASRDGPATAGDGPAMAGAIAASAVSPLESAFTPAGDGSPAVADVGDGDVLLMLDTTLPETTSFSEGASASLLALALALGLDEVADGDSELAASDRELAVGPAGLPLGRLLVVGACVVCSEVTG